MANHVENESVLLPSRNSCFLLREEVGPYTAF